MTSHAHCTSCDAQEFNGRGRAYMTPGWQISWCDELQAMRWTCPKCAGAGVSEMERTRRPRRRVEKPQDERQGRLL